MPDLINWLLTSIILLIIGLCFIFTLKWLIFTANWKVVTQNLPLYAFGSFPPNQRWRPAIWIFSLLILSVFTLIGPNWGWFRKGLPLAWVSTIPLGIYLLSGGFGLSSVMSSNWGGLSLTILLTECSLFFSLPLGIFLALCRQSKLPLVNSLSSIYIDSMRAVPLIAVLFFGQLLIPLFLPIGIQVDRVWRAIFAFTLFVSAYIAEDIRGGLQAIPDTQIEAAETLGLNQFQITHFVLIPQALRIALPALTNQAIGLFQNTSLMAILGLVELLGVGRGLLANPEFIGQYIEVYIWLASVYWLFCTFMAIIGRHLEHRMTLDKGNL
ncbi:MULTISPECIES: amino acid ABC transporter permease [unclassified Prochlorococcus]|uniref:amino acid ABC transporter permease n=1 Tax=unclassified Prochlorococcus TaxID=2627481 RepID=UPI000A8E4027|nr:MULTISPECIES: amino acid ABC transporter permease [unclassified Prochlorococcus]